MAATSILTPDALIDGRYRLTSPLGEGTFGDVWRAVDGRLSQRVVAVKFLKPEFLERPEIVRRFEAEADALASVQHPNVVALFDRGRWGDRHYLVTEYVEGRPLTAWIEQHRARGVFPDVGAVLALFDQICAGVEAAHTVRVPGPIVHRDLKPDNVLLRVLSNGESLVKILDFGIAQLGGRSGTRTGALMGTPIYMAPEQAMGNTAGLGPWTDVFALGVILVEMLTLRPQVDLTEPWWGTALRREGDVPALLRSLRAEVPAPVWTATVAALRADGPARPADAGALRAMVRSASERPSDLGFAKTALIASGAHAPPWSQGAPPAAPWESTEFGGASGPRPTTLPSNDRGGPRQPGAARPLLIGAGAAVLLLGAGGLAMSARGRSVEAGREQDHAVTRSETAALGDAPRGGPCRVTMTSSFHLRPVETLSSVGTEYPSGTEVDVLSRGVLERRGNAIFRVQVSTDQARGWVFLDAQELAPCGSRWTTGARVPEPEGSGNPPAAAPPSVDDARLERLVPSSVSASSVLPSRRPEHAFDGLPRTAVVTTSIPRRARWNSPVSTS